MKKSTNSRIQIIISALVVATGTALMIMKIVTDSEPGAIPLFLVIAGAGWFFIARSKSRSKDE